MNPKNYSVSEVFNNTQLGMKFEFYSSKDTKFIVEDLSKTCAKNVILTGDKKIEPTWSIAILLKEYNGKRPRYQLKLAPQDFMSIGQILHDTLKWINEEAVLDYSTKLQISLLYKNFSLQTLSTISNMDIGKLILKMDESLIFDRFPEMKLSPFSLSVKRIIPYDGFINSSVNLKDLKTSFKFPVSENFAIDFTEQHHGILKFNYIGGSDYAKKGEEINETIKYYVLTTYNVLNSKDYTNEMKYELEKMLENYSKLRRAYYEPDFFLKEYKDIKVEVDLNRNAQTIKSYWNKIRNPLFSLLIEGQFKKGYFNYNSDESKFEVKDAKLKGSTINGFCLVGCEVEGLVENCSLWKCKTKNTKISKSVLVSGNKIFSSLLESCRVDASNKIEKCYIINTGEIINCSVNESVIINAGIGSSAKLDENCTLVQTTEKNTPPMNKGVSVEEVRDYKWLKSLRKSEETKGFGNEYKYKW